MGLGFQERRNICSLPRLPSVRLQGVVDEALHLVPGLGEDRRPGGDGKVDNCLPVAWTVGRDPDISRLVVLVCLPVGESAYLSSIALPARAKAIADLETLGQSQLPQAAHATSKRWLVYACVGGKLFGRAARVPADQIEDTADPRATAAAAVEPGEC